MIGNILKFLTNIKFLFIFIFLSSIAYSQQPGFPGFIGKYKKYYVSTTGTDDASGKIDNPWSMNKANTFSNYKKRDVVYFLPGTYTSTLTANATKVTYAAYNLSDRPVIFGADTISTFTAVGAEAQIDSIYSSPTQSTDDCYYRNYYLQLTGSSLVGYYLSTSGNNTAIRFRNITIPSGVIIDSAKIIWYASSDESGTVASWKIYGEDKATIREFTTYTDAQNRDDTLTTAYTLVSSAESYTSGLMYVYDVKDVIAELYSKYTYNNGDIGIFIMDNGSTSYRRFRTYDYGSIYPILKIYYSTPSVNYYIKIVTDSVYQVFFNDTLGTQVGNASLVDAPKEWYYANDTLAVYDTTNVLATIRNGIIVSNDVVISGFNVEKSFYGIKSSGTIDTVHIKQNLLKNNYYGIIDSAIGNALYNHNIFLNNKTNLFVVNKPMSHILNNVFIHNYPELSLGINIDIRNGLSNHFKLKNNLLYTETSRLGYVDNISSPTEIDYNGYTYKYQTNGYFWVINEDFYDSLTIFQSLTTHDDHSWDIKSWKASPYNLVSNIWTNISTEDFTLKTGSPAINSGINVSLTKDYVGNNIPMGTLFDMGAYESIPDVTPPSAPTLFAMGSSTTTTLTATWTDPVASDLAKIYLRLNGVLVDSVNPGIETYTFTSLTENTHYYADARARDNSYNYSLYCDTSGTNTLTSLSSGWVAASPGAGGWYRNVIFDPSNKNIVYITGDRSSVDKSTDGGETWTKVTDGIMHLGGEGLDINPNNSNILLFGSYGGIYKSTNAGTSWYYVGNDSLGINAEHPKLERGPIDPISGVSNYYRNGMHRVHFHPANPSICFAGMGAWGGTTSLIQRTRLFRSADTGETWTMITSGLPDYTVKDAIWDICGDPNDANIVYLGTDDDMYKSTNSGVDWTKISTDNAIDIEVDPNNSNIVYKVIKYDTLGVYKSTNSGGSWFQIANLGNGFLEQNARFRHIKFDPDNNTTLYVAGDPEDWGGEFGWFKYYMYKSTNGGTTWTPLGKTFWDRWALGYVDADTTGWDDVAPFATAFDVQDGNIVMAPTPFYSHDGGTTWNNGYCTTTDGEYFSSTGIDLLCAEAIVESPLIPGLMLMATGDNFMKKSTDGGVSWINKQQVFDSGDYAPYSGRAIAFSPDDEDIVYALVEDNAGMHGCVVKSTDQGDTWYEVGISTLPEERMEKIIAFSSSNLMLITYYADVYTSTDGGNNWTWRMSPGGWLSGISKDPNTSGVAYAYGYNYDNAKIYKTTNYGSSWSLLTINDSLQYMRSLTVSPFGNSDTMWVTTSRYGDNCGTGAYMSTNGGVSWQLKFHLLTDSWGYTATNEINYGEIIVDTETGYLYCWVSDSGQDYPIFRGLGVYVSEDKGESWTHLDGLKHELIRSMWITHNPTAIYVGTGCNGVFKYTP